MGRTPQTQTTNQRVGGTKKRPPPEHGANEANKGEGKETKKGKTKNRKKKTRQKRKTAAAGEQEIPKNKALCRGGNERNGNKNEKGAKHTNSSELKSIPLHHKPSPAR